MRTIPGEADGVWDREHLLLTVGLVLTVSMAAFEAIAVATILPATVADIGGFQLYGWAFSSFLLAEIIGISVAGPAGDSRGLATPFAIGGAAFVVGLLGAGTSTSMPGLIAWRVLQGLGAGAVSTLAYAAVARGYATGARPRMLALLSTAWVVPGLIGPAVSAAIHAYAGWRWVFLALAPLSTLAVALALPGLRSLGPASDAPPASNRTTAAAVLTASAAALLAALSLDATLSVLALGAPALAVGLLSFRRLAPEGTLRARPGLPAAIAVMGLLSAAFFGAEIFVPLSLTEIRHRSVAFGGIALTAATLSWTAGAWVQAKLASHASRRALVATGLLLLSASIAIMASVLLPSVHPAIAIPTWGIAGLGIGLAYSTTALVVLECAPPGEEGSASSAMQLANVLGTAIGTGVGGAVLARISSASGSTPGSTSKAIFITDALALAASLAALSLAMRLPGRPGARA